MTVRPRLLAGVVLLGLALTAGCSSPCQASLGTYPPAQILVRGVEAVEVPHIAWTCDDFHADSMEPPPVVPPDSERNVSVEVTLEPGSTMKARFGNEPVALVPASVDGANIFQLRVPDPPQPLVIDICSEDERCAMYWVNTYAS